jgi:5'-deoxynucleotidase YfbR-like HD superfamily hydrolase
MTKNLPDEMKDEIRNLFLEFEKGKTKEAKVAREADKLEQLFQEKRHIESGVKEAEGWLDYSLKNLQLRSSKKIGKTASEGRFSDWWAPLSQEPPLKARKKGIASLLKIITK